MSDAVKPPKPSAVDPADPCSHWSQSVRWIEDRADELAKRKLDEGAAEVLIEARLHSAAFYPEWRAKLLEIGMARFRA